MKHDMQQLHNSVTTLNMESISLGFMDVGIRPGHNNHFWIVSGYKVVPASSEVLQMSVCDWLCPSSTPASPHRVFLDSRGDMACDIPPELPP